MTRPPQSAIEREEPLTRRDRLLIFLGTPFCLLVLAVELRRLWEGLRGGGLLIAAWPDPDIVVRWSEGPLRFAGGLALHAAILLCFGFGLAASCTLAARWFRGWRR